MVLEGPIVFLPYEQEAIEDVRRWRRKRTKL